MNALEKRYVEHLKARYQNLRKEATRASAELRHAYKVKADWELVSRAIKILEVAVPSEDDKAL